MFPFYFPGTPLGNPPAKRILDEDDSPLENKKQKTTDSSSPPNPKVKRRRILAVCDSDSDSENQSSNKKPSPKKKSPAKKKQSPKKKSPAKKETPAESNVSAKLAKFQNTEKSEAEVESSVPDKKSPDKEVKLFDDEPTQWIHLTLDFLQPNKIKDASGRRPDHPEYDPRTLFVPEAFLNKQTPGARQWWVLKAQYFDCILFFKVGKFYEMYHMDAVVSVQELQVCQLFE